MGWLSLYKITKNTEIKSNGNFKIRNPNITLSTTTTCVTKLG